MSCGGAAAASRATYVDPSTQAIIEGQVTRDGAPVPRAYVRLLDRNGEFTAEVPTGDAGDFRFYAAPGEWTVRALAPQSAAVEAKVSAVVGEVVEVQLEL